MKILRILALAVCIGAAGLFAGTTPAAAHGDGFVGVQVGPIGLGLDVDDDDWDGGGYDRCGDRCDDCWWGHHWRNYYYDDCRRGCDEGWRGTYWDDGWSHRHHCHHRHYHHRRHHHRRHHCD